jgi:putative transposase
LPYHVTDRGTNRRIVFFTAADRSTCLRLLAAIREEARVWVLSCYLMTNHVHPVVVPETEDSLAVLFRRLHRQYAHVLNTKYLNTRRQRSGHLRQKRSYCCPFSTRHFWAAPRYVECEPAVAALGLRE